MPQKDTIHDIVRRAVERAGWRIVSEQWMLEEDELRVFIDMAAEPTPRLQIPFHQGPIAVEVKSFRGASFIERREKTSRF
jgi:tRNA nucleotidyltransferase (CCA-adding enzyme)